ncbi:MAG: hypothetical protein JWN48_4949 [Myxococcaceae bacterium]|nr:hypothetical protein [Myxococcaceae bacterium]
MDEIAGARGGKVLAMLRNTASALCWSLALHSLSLSACDASGGAPSTRDMDGELEHFRDAGRSADAASPEARADAATVLGAALDAGTQRLDASASDAALARADASASLACGTVAPSSCPTPPVRYADVEPIFRTHCVVCHSPLWTGPWPLDAYQHVSDWQADIRADMLDCSMPLRDGGVPITITLEERQQILAFLRCGLPM